MFKQIYCTLHLTKFYKISNPPTIIEPVANKTTEKTSKRPLKRSKYITIYDARSS